MKVAIPVWQGRIAPVLDSAHCLNVVELSGGNESDRLQIDLGDTNPRLRALELIRLKPDVVLCGAISRPLHCMLAGAGIRIIAGLSGEVSNALSDYLRDFNPVRRGYSKGNRSGCQRRRRRRHGQVNCEKRGAGKMKILITSRGSELDDEVDPRFGRAAWFILYDVDSGDFSAQANDAATGQGAGIQAAQTVSELGAECVITGNIGPNAIRVLQEARIDVCFVSGGTVRDAIQSFRDGRLLTAQKANAQPGAGL